VTKVKRAILLQLRAAIGQPRPIKLRPSPGQRHLLFLDAIIMADVQIADKMQPAAQ
jgi:hypothetical protein